jgi:hypothetical protein
MYSKVSSTSYTTCIEILFTQARIVTPRLFIDEIGKMSVRIIYNCVSITIDKAELRELWLNTASLEVLITLKVAVRIVSDQCFRSNKLSVQDNILFNVHFVRQDLETRSGRY